MTRAPGRLDVMGGIADYSGSLVLQLPLGEACHVALQRQRPSAERPAALRVVSLNSQAAGRSPSFEMPLSALADEASGSPVSYEAAREYFRRDPASSWAAYVAGALVVLIRERGDRFADSISILVASGEPSAGHDQHLLFLSIPDASSPPLTSLLPDPLPGAQMCRTARA